MTRAVVFDTETTGLIPNRVIAIDYQPYVIEVYAAVFDLETGTVEGELDSLVRPPIPIPDKVAEYTKITTAMVASAPRFVDVLPQLRKIIEEAEIVYAHNAHFDVEVVDVECIRARVPPIAWPVVICTIEQSSFLKGHRLGLGELYTFLFNEKFLDAHRARADATALKRCIVEMVRKDLL